MRHWFVSDLCDFNTAIWVTARIRRALLALIITCYLDQRSYQWFHRARSSLRSSRCLKNQKVVLVIVYWCTFASGGRHQISSYLQRECQLCSPWWTNIANSINCVMLKNSWTDLGFLFDKTNIIMELSKLNEGKLLFNNL